MMPKKLNIRVVNGKIISITDSDISCVEIDNKEYKFESGYIMPSLVDSHAHIIGLGMKLNNVDLEQAKSKAEVLKLIKQIEVQDGWITGRGWNEEIWGDKELNRFDLDSISTEIPIFLVRVDGHAAWVNSKAITLCSIDTNTEDPDGGKIIKDAQGMPNGLLIDNAIELVRDNIPLRSIETTKKYILDACNECLRVGITEVHDMDVHIEDIEAYKELDRENKLPIRLIQYIRGFDGEYQKHQTRPYIGNKLKIIGLKFYADGALGSRGALMIEKYKDADSYGLELISKEKLFEKVKLACENSWDIAVHAIGDKANRNILDVYESIRKVGYNNCLRIEHSQLISPTDIKRFAELNVVASVQPIHCTSDKKMAIDRLGEGYNYFYPWKTLIDAGTNLIAGSDFPIESHNPILGIDAFVNRIGKGETETWVKAETLTIEEAIDYYSKIPHQITKKLFDYMSFAVNDKAEFIVVSNDLESNSTIKECKILATISDGNITKHL